MNILEIVKCIASTAVGVAAGTMADTAMQNVLDYGRTHTFEYKEGEPYIVTTVQKPYGKAKQFWINMGVAGIRSLVAAAATDKTMDLLNTTENTVRSIINPSLTKQEVRAVRILKEMGYSPEEIANDAHLPINAVSEVYYGSNEKAYPDGEN